jgi:fatty-acid desaturase
VTDKARREFHFAAADAAAAGEIARKWADGHRSWARRADVHEDPPWELRRLLLG